MTEILHNICQLSELVKHKSLGKQLQVHEQNIDLMLLYHYKHCYVYLNQCPHTGVNLEWQAHQFFDSSKQFIQCAMHGALFRIHDGYCIHGPCNGDSLTPIDTVIENGWIKADFSYLTPVEDN